MDFELTRSENDKELLPLLESIKSAENIQTLIPFAKAYLGMFYVIDKELPESEKVSLLANNELADAIFKGFLNSLKRKGLPAIEEIGHKKAEKEEYAEGYVILAGLDIIAKKSLADISDLNMDVIELAIGFHFSNKSGYHDIWFDYLLSEHKEKVIPLISRYWVSMLKNKASFLPGRNLILSEQPDVDVIQYCILPLLDNWSNCKAKTLSQLLYLAFKYSNTNDFLKVCERKLKNSEKLNERAHLYWLASAYLLSPDMYFANLSSYVGRVKLKTMPLLDFVVLVMNNHNDMKIKFNTKIIMQLLRMIAPAFPPQHHIYGAIGELDINSKNIMSMFYYLACSDEADISAELKLLRKARVMKIYSAVIDNLLELKMRKNNEKDFLTPDFDKYIETLVNSNCLQGRSNKFDLR